jgi:hypothetical protein
MRTMKLRTMKPGTMKPILTVLLLLVAGVSAGVALGQNQPSPTQTQAVQTPMQQPPGAGSDLGHGTGDVAKGAGGAVGHTAAGVGKGAGDIATLHPVKGAGAVGEGVGKGAVSAGKGVGKGTGKIAKGTGKLIKKPFSRHHKQTDDTPH